MVRVYAFKLKGRGNGSAPNLIFHYYLNNSQNQLILSLLIKTRVKRKLTLNKYVHIK